jgi:hypothetical protein
MNETPYLFAAGKSVITADGTRATLMEFLGRKPIADRTVTELTKRGAIPDNDPADFEDVVSDHFEWCDDCDSSKDAYHHEMASLSGADYPELEPPC